MRINMLNSHHFSGSIVFYYLPFENSKSDVTLLFHYFFASDNLTWKNSSLQNFWLGMQVVYCHRQSYLVRHLLTHSNPSLRIRILWYQKISIDNWEILFVLKEQWVPKVCYFRTVKRLYPFSKSGGALCYQTTKKW